MLLFLTGSLGRPHPQPRPTLPYYTLPYPTTPYLTLLHPTLPYPNAPTLCYCFLQVLWAVHIPSRVLVVFCNPLSAPLFLDSVAVVATGMRHVAVPQR